MLKAPTSISSGNCSPLNVYIVYPGEILRKHSAHCRCCRSQLIPGIVIFLQKMARGSLARKQYQRMLAARAIWGKYRKYKMRSYVNTLQKTFRWIQLDNVITIALALCICASIVLMIQ